MKHSKLLALLITLFGITACFDSNLDDCPAAVEPNTTVRFSLTDAGGNESLPTSVQSIALFVYNVDGMLVERVELSRSDLAAFAGARLLLDPGVYTLVAWANATTAYTQIVTDGTVSYLDRTKNYLQNAVASGGIVKNGAPLYYAPKEPGTPLIVVVPQEGNVDVVAHMRHAHIKIEVTVVGYRHARAVADPLSMELTQLTSRYDFALNRFGAPVSYTRSAPNINEVTMEFWTLFNVPLFDRNTGTELLVRDKANNQIVPPIVLRDLIGNQIDLDQIVHIPIKIDFNTGSSTIKAIITVELPTWGETIVVPG